MHSYHRASHSAAMTSVGLRLLGEQYNARPCSPLPSWPGLDGARLLTTLLANLSTTPAHPHLPIFTTPFAGHCCRRDHRYFLLHTPPPLILRLLLLPPAQTPPAQPHDRADTRDCLLFVAGTLPLRHSHRCEYWVRNVTRTTTQPLE